MDRVIGNIPSQSTVSSANMAQSPVSRPNNFSHQNSPPDGLTPSNPNLTGRLPLLLGSQNQTKSHSRPELPPEASIATPDSLVDLSHIRPTTGQPSRLSRDSTGASVSSVNTMASSLDSRRKSIALAENSLSNSPNSKVGIYLHQVRNGIPSPTPRPKELPMSKSDVLHVKQLADEYLNRDPQAQRLKTQVTRLVNHTIALDEARYAGLVSSKRKIDTLNDYIHSLTLTKQSSTSRLELQSTEIDLLKRQAIALSNKMSASPVMNRCLPSPSPCSITKRKNDENCEAGVEYPGTNYSRNNLESQNKLLMLDNKNLGNKLEHAEAQIQRLTKELKKLRSLLVSGGSDTLSFSGAQDASANSVMEAKLNRDREFLKNSRYMNSPSALTIASPMAPHVARSLTRSVPYKRRPTMGDAETEHLLLASERLTSISKSRNSANSIAGSYLNSPSIKLASQRLKHPSRPKRLVSDSGLPERRLSEPTLPLGNLKAIKGDQEAAVQGYRADRQAKDLIQIDEDEEEKVLEKMIVPNRLTFVPQVQPQSQQQQPKEPKTSGNCGEKRAGLMDDLLAAAETVLTRVSSPALCAEDDVQTRRKKSKSDVSSSDGTTSKISLVVDVTQKEDQLAQNSVVGLQKYPSGLDVLADQAFASSSQKKDDVITPESLSSSSLSPCSINQASTPAQTHIAFSSELSDLEMDDHQRQRQQQSNAANDQNVDIDPSLSSLDQNNFKSQSGSQRHHESKKKMRSPYVKWNSTEDELLVKAVSKYGLRWESVSRCVPSRSYHQCRQRWLRGLKGGENLPEELRDYYPAIQTALKIYNLSRKRINSIDGETGIGSNQQNQPDCEEDEDVILDEDDEGEEYDEDHREDENKANFQETKRIDEEVEDQSGKRDKCEEEDFAELYGKKNDGRN